MQASLTSRQDNNNFNFLRVFLSLSVLFYHAHVLSQQQPLSFLSVVFNADRAVQAFFVISGYLVMKSYTRSRSVRDYFTRRFKRIYPAYFVVIIACAIAGNALTSFSLTQYLGSVQLYKYILANLCFLNFIEPSLPGVFDHNFNNAVNGSLWTLKIEVSFYVIVPLLFFLKRKVNAHVLYGGLFALSIGYYFTMLFLYKRSNNDMFLFLSRQLPGQLFYFLLGVWANELDSKTVFKRVISWIGLPCIVTLFFPVGVFAGSIALAIAVFFVAVCVPAIPYPYKREDISYGLYIYHFPVIQSLVYYGIFAASPFAGLLLSILFTVVLASLSWWYIEKPLIKPRLTQQFSF